MISYIKREGNKNLIAHNIIKYFPQHETFIDIFFGVGGIFFNKEPAKYNFINDIDDNIYNFYMTLKNNKTELINEINTLIASEKLFNHFQTTPPQSNIEKAVRFFYLHNFSQFGSTRSFNIVFQNNKTIQIETTKLLSSKLNYSNVIILKTHFKNILNKIVNLKKESSFIYADPPYLDTDARYHKHHKQGKWKRDDTNLLFKILYESGIRFAISEFENEIILELVKKYNLNYIKIMERKNIKNIRTEILITNYSIEKDQHELF